MKITYLGTSAAEGFPAVYCNCEHCREAKRLKGKNIRTRSQAIINDDLLIDFPADTYSHFLNNDIDGDKIGYLLVTHSHTDHFYLDELDLRRVPCTYDMRAETLKIYSSEGAAKIMDNDVSLRSSKVDYAPLLPFEKVSFDDYEITALPARHYTKDNALIFIIRQADKSIFYAHDTGYLYDEVFDYIKDNGLLFDLVSLDCTNVDIPTPDDATHMGIDNNNRVVEKLRCMGAVTDSTKIVLSHFTHIAGPIQHKLEERVKEYGYIISYDGLTIDL